MRLPGTLTGSAGAASRRRTRATRPEGIALPLLLLGLALFLLGTASPGAVARRAVLDPIEGEQQAGLCDDSTAGACLSDVSVHWADHGSDAPGGGIAAARYHHHHLAGGVTGLRRSRPMPALHPYELPPVHALPPPDSRMPLAVAVVVPLSLPLRQ